MAGTLSELIDKEFGIETRPVENPLTNTVDATAVELFHQNPNRLAFLVVNLSANRLYVAPNPAVSTTHGILLAAQGGILVMHYKEDFHLVGYPFWCIGSAVGTDFYCLEIVSER